MEVELLSGRRLTVEGVASSAKVNKVLVYRYFGGMPGLIAAYAESDSFMPAAQELLSWCSSDVHSLSKRQRFVQCIRAYIEALSCRPATVQILLRLPGFDVQTLKALQVGRARGIQEIRQAFGEPDNSLGFDSDLGFNLLISGVCHLLGARHASWMEDEIPLPELAGRLADTIEAFMLPRTSCAKHHGN